MKKLLKKIENKLYHFEDGIKVEGKNKDLFGDCSNLFGDCSGLFGDCSNLFGDCSGLFGNLDECEISDEERKKGIDIKELIK
jgi:hypothetical protein